MASKHMKRFPTSRVIREMKIKITRYNFTLTRMAVIEKKQTIRKQTIGKLEHSHTAGRNIR